MIGIQRGGLLTTVQDTGRHHVQHHGMVTAGAMDDVALRVANLLVGNPPDAAGLECTMIGPVIEMQCDAVIAIGGADLDASLDDRRVPLWRPFVAPRGSILALGNARSGCRTYIAFGGGVDVAPVLGSRATDLIACIGGHGGRALAAGDELPLGEPTVLTRRIMGRVGSEPRIARAAGRSLIPAYAQEPILRIVRGPEHDRFTMTSRTLLTEMVFDVTTQSNRMGIRLTGPPLSLEGAYDLFSSPVTAGMIQVPPSGEPIVLMADHQTIGGYPRIAAVATVDLPLLAQATPGTSVRFHEIDVPEAQALLLRRERDIRVFAESLRYHYA